MSAGNSHAHDANLYNKVSSLKKTVNTLTASMKEINKLIQQLLFLHQEYEYKPG